MPCRSDYLEVNAEETFSKEVCGHLVYVFSMLHKPVPQNVARGATNYYGDLAGLDANTALLCSTIQGMSKAEQDLIVYNGRDDHARRLACWWEAHQSADLKREKAEAAELAKQQLRASAVAKLTPEELESLKD